MNRPCLYLNLQPNDPGVYSLPLCYPTFEIHPGKVVTKWPLFCYKQTKKAKFFAFCDKYKFINYTNWVINITMNKTCIENSIKSNVNGLWRYVKSKNVMILIHAQQKTCLVWVKLTLVKKLNWTQRILVNVNNLLDSEFLFKSIYFSIPYIRIQNCLLNT